MKNIFIKSTMVGLLVIALPLTVGAVKAGAQSDSDDSPNELSGDGVRNVLQDEEFGEYGGGTGESPSEISGDGVPNASQDEDFGQYGGEVMDGVGQGPKTTTGQQAKTQNAGEVSQIQVRAEARTVGELEELMGQERARIQKEVAATDEETRGVRGQRESAELAVRAMMAVGPMLGDGQSAQRMQELAAMVGAAQGEALKAELKTQQKSGFMRFFTGGDGDAADELTKATERNRVAVQEMNQLVEDCEACDEAEREVLREQIRAIESELDRTTAVADRERTSGGLFGFLFGWLS